MVGVKRVLVWGISLILVALGGTAVAFLLRNGNGGQETIETTSGKETIPTDVVLQEPDTARSHRLIKLAGEATELASGSDPDAAAKLKRVVEDEDDFVRQYALSGLVKLEGKKALPIVLRMAKSKHQAAQLRAAFELGQLGDATAIPVLTELSTKGNPVLRLACVRALAKIRDKRAIPPIIDRIADDDQKVREAARKSLKNLTGKSLAFRQVEGTEGKLSFKRATPEEELDLWKSWWRENESTLQWDGKGSRLKVKQSSKIEQREP